jgi:hypothetical protein
MKTALAFVCLCLFVAACGRADTVTLKDGTVIEGMIVSETDAEFVLKIEYAGGTISREQRVAKADVLELARATDEELMERAYEETRRHQLDPMTSLAPEVYDQTITNIFLAFLRRYTNSAHTQELTEKIEQWQAERDRVAAGEVRYRGEWLSGNEAAKAMNKARLTRQIQQARMLMSQRQYEQAIAQFHAASLSPDDAGLAAEARRLEGEACQTWVNVLTRQQQEAQQLVAQAEERVSSARQELERKQKILAHTQEVAKETRVLGQDGFFLQQTMDIKKAEASVQFAEQLLTKAREQEEAVTLRLAKIQGDAGNVQPLPTETIELTAAPEPTESARSLKSPDVLSNLTEMAQNYWLVAVAAVGLILWFLWRATN